jgi:hypothetical protein
MHSSAPVAGQTTSAALQQHEQASLVAVVMEATTTLTAGTITTGPHA